MTSDKTSGVIYFNMNTCHLARLAVSLWYLRKVYSGSVCILNGGGDNGLAAQIAADKRLDVECRNIPVKQYRRHTAYVAKASLWRHTRYDWNVYLDGDTLPVVDISPLFNVMHSPGSDLIVTRFSNWVTCGNIYGSRIKQWRDVTCPLLPGLQAVVEECKSQPRDAINTGVFAFNRWFDYRPVSDITLRVIGEQDGKMFLPLRAWEELTAAGGERCSFTDELAMQLLVQFVPATLLPDLWNASPIYRTCPPEDVKIWHFHGCKNLRKDAAREVWWPAFQETLRENVGGIREWYQLDKSLKGLTPADVLDGAVA